MFREKKRGSYSSALLSTRKRISAFLHCNALQPPSSKCPTLLGLGRDSVHSTPFTALHCSVCNALHGTWHQNERRDSMHWRPFTLHYNAYMAPGIKNGRRDSVHWRRAPLGALRVLAYQTATAAATQYFI